MFSYTSPPSQTTQANTGFSFASPSNTSQSQSYFSTPATTSSSGFIFGQSAPGFGNSSTIPAATTTIPSLSFASTIPTTTSTTFGFSSGFVNSSSIPAATTTTPSLSFASTASTTSSTFAFPSSATSSGLFGVQPNQTAPSSGFAGFTPAVQPSSGGFMLGNTTNATASTTTSLFSSGTNTVSFAAPVLSQPPGWPSNVTTSSGPSLGFSSLQSTTTTSIPFPGINQSTAPSISLGTSTSTSGSTLGLGILSNTSAITSTTTSITAPQPSSSSYSFSFSQGNTFNSNTSTTTTPSTGLPAFTSSANTNTGFSSPSFALGTTTMSSTTNSAAITSKSVFSTSGTTTSTSTLPFSLGLKTVTTTPSTSAFNIRSSTGFSMPDSAITSTPASLVTTTSTTLSSTAGPTMNYRQLEEAINKWTLELEEQEKIFLTQATQVNAWDRLLTDNGEKITQLNSEVECLKVDQQHLDHELDFILVQQKELEDLLIPLEKSVESQLPINYQQHADLEREHTYQLSESIDAQMKRMVQDLKEIIDHLNAASNNQDSNDPIFQIAKILNAHMDSLQWVDQNTALLQRKVEEVAKQYEVRRQEQERNFRLAYD